MKYTYIYNTESENILQTEYPKLILNKNTYCNYDIPLILKDITKIDKVDISNLGKIDRETFNLEISDTILKKWLQLENTIFFELEKLFYVFFCLYSSSKKFLLVSWIKSLINFVYNPYINFYSIYKNHRTIKDYCTLNHIESAKDCLIQIFRIFEALDSFLAEMRDKIKMFKNGSKKFDEILNKRIFSYDITVYSLYLVFREFFIETDDLMFLNNCLKNIYIIKYENYQKENRKKDIHFDYEDYDYINHFNKNISVDVIN